MATSGGGFGGGPTLPMSDNLVVNLIVFILIIAAVFFVVTRVFDS